jgi:MSHA biogenesis protein MshJ
MSKWQEYSDKFQNISSREQYLILMTGLVAVIFISFSFFIDSTLAKTTDIEDKSKGLVSENKSIRSSIAIFEEALAKDPNQKLNEQITAYEKRVKQVDDKLLLLTSELIDPIQMRFALLDMLKVQKGVSLVSFELLGAKPLMGEEGDLADESHSEKEETQTASINSDNVDASNVNDSVDIEPNINLYQHGIRLKLTGKYFQLRDYLTQLEAMPWKFFWKNFQYKIEKYPLGELEIEMYSLSTNEDFIGV